MFVVCAAERHGLQRRAGALADFLERRPNVCLKDLAYTLNTEAGSGSARLAVVAGSPSELRLRLLRVAGRLADPKCRQIKDTQGIYYFDEPLHPQGRLAVLFPGEGAQYLNMVVGLFEHFPEVREHFERCDRISVAAGHAEPMSRTVFLPAQPPAEQRATAEKELWRLNNAVASVMTANWGIYRVLSGLGLRADAFAGHSTGECSALAAAGCLEVDDFMLGQLFAMGHWLQQQENEGLVAEATLLAVGTGRRKVAEAIELDEPAVCFAMDNCPHQTVVVGPPETMSGVEARLRARGIVCERLPFNRPYHTPLFEPVLGPIARMYQVLPVQPARKPIYSCVTGRPFPADADGIRRLAVVQWASTVEFTRLIEAMYADGVRLFVESGPRGNLTAFVEDILRGRAFAAIPADLPQRSSITQLNHLMGQLAAHHVPLDFERFYRRRQPSRVEWLTELGAAHAERAERLLAATAPCAAATELAAAADSGLHAPYHMVLAQYCRVMEQFLNIEREVMERFLGSSAKSTQG